MSDHLESSSYANCFGVATDKIDTRSYEYQFRVLVMRLFMDLLSLDQIESFFFVYKLPQRLRDYGRERLRPEVLRYIGEVQLLDTWRKTPRVLQDVLEALGCSSLAIKVQEFVERYPAATVCQETTPATVGGSSPQQESPGAGKLHKQAPPVQETQRFCQTLQSVPAKDEVHRDSGDGDREDRSSTEGEVCCNREVQPCAPSASNTLQQSSRQNLITVARKGVKQCGELENIVEENLSQEDDKNDSTGSLKRSASTVSHDSMRSSGYYSNPRLSDLRISQVSICESIAERDPDESDGTGAMLGSIKQACGDGTAEDEGVVMKIDHTSEFLESCESTEAELSGSNVGPQSPSHSLQASCKKEEEVAAALNNQDDLLGPVSRPRLFQMSYSPSHKIKQLKQTDGDLSPEHTEIRRRSHSLPTTTSNTEHLRNAALQLIPPISSLQYPAPSHSSSTSLDSDTTYGSASEQSSMTGSQLSISSSISGHDSKPNSLSRRLSPPNQKPLPVVSEMMFSGSMKIKMKDIHKSIERNNQNPVTSDEFPRVKGHHGPRYEMRFFPSNFGKGNSSLYIDVARSYLHKKAKNKEHRRPIEIPSMMVTVHLSYGSESSGEDGTRGHEVKSETMETGVKKIDLQGEASSKRCVVASFPQLVSHTELGLSDVAVDGRSSLVIRVDMNVRSW